MKKAKEFVTRAVSAVANDNNMKKVDEVKGKLERAFNDHPNHAGETYFQHLLFTLRMAVTILISVAALLIHGFLPFLFTKTASNNFKKMNQELQDRAAKVVESEKRSA